MRLQRMTTRRWMIVILMVALIFGAFSMAQRRAYFQDLAVSHWMVASRIFLSRTWVPGPDGKMHLSPLPEKLKRRWEYHDTMSSKYEHAAAHPWLLVEPDPPPTE
jgi:hypothetical protein